MTLQPLTFPDLRDEMTSPAAGSIRIGSNDARLLRPALVPRMIRLARRLLRQPAQA